MHLSRASFVFTPLLIGTALFSSSDRPVFTRQDKAYYADQATVNFVRPGLQLKLTGATLAQDGTLQAQFTLADPKGLPLDRLGVTTPGEISTSFIASYIPKGATDYIALTHAVQTSPITKQSANQPATDAGGTYQDNGNGQYTYTFATKAASGFDTSQTLSVGAYAERDLSDFDLGTNVSNSVFTFIPAGGQPTDVHQVVRTETCDKCHDPLAAHGGFRRQVALCVLCHNPGGAGVDTVDPDTGNSIDFKVMIHKIHMGEQLPSVVAGKPYQIIGFRQSVHDFSTVAFPADPRNCQMCHEAGAPPQGGTAPPGSMTEVASGKNVPAQADWWITHVSRAACGACHDNVNFATGENHDGGLVELDDNQCTTCHIPQGELPFDASILGAHLIPQFASDLPGVVFTIDKVTNNAAGQQPMVTFTVKDKKGNPVDAATMDFLNLTIAGPTTDFQTVWAEDARKASGSGGVYTYTFQKGIPADAKGTYAVGIEGFKTVTLLPGTVTQMTARDVGDNVISNFPVDNSPAAPHMVEVMNANCNQCHYKISAHGTVRNNTQYCIFCHNPNATDAGRRPADQNPPQGIDFPVLIHRIHTGADAEPDGQLTPFIVWGFGNRPNDFSDVRFPGDRRDCMKCHVNDSQHVETTEDHTQVQDPRAFANPMGPTAAACTACHTPKDAVAHTQLMTSPTLGESCGVCHGADADFAVDKVHARSL